MNWHDVVIFERDYKPFNNKWWDEDAEIRAQRKQYLAYFSPYAAREREKELYREEVLQRLKENIQKTPVFLKAISIFNEYAKNEHGSIKAYVNETNMKATIEIISFFLFDDDEKVSAFLKEQKSLPVLSYEGSRRFVYRITFDLN